MTDTEPTLAGFRTGALLTAGPSGVKQWAARDDEDRPAVVRHVLLPPERRAGYTERLRALQRLSPPGTVRVLAVAGTPHGVMFAVDPPAGVDLATWRTRVGPLPPRQLEILAAHLSDVLMAVAEGAIGSLSLQHVMLDGEGTFVLDLTAPSPGRASTGEIAALVAAAARSNGKAPCVEEDPGFPEEVDRDLADLLDAAATGSGEPDLALLAGAARAAVARHRDEARPGSMSTRAADLAAEAMRHYVLSAPDVRPPPRRGAAAAVFAVALALGLAGAAGVDAATASVPAHAGTVGAHAGDVVAHAGAVVAQSRPTTQPDPLDLAEAVTARDAALIAGDLRLLATAVAPGSPAWTHDVALITSLNRRGTRVLGLHTMASIVEPLDGEPLASEPVLTLAWWQQRAHLRLEYGALRWVEPQPGWCAAVVRDAAGRLVAVEVVERSAEQVDCGV